MQGLDVDMIPTFKVSTFEPIYENLRAYTGWYYTFIDRLGGCEGFSKVKGTFNSFSTFYRYGYRSSYYCRLLHLL